MDLVKLSAASGIALVSALVIAASGGQGHAGPLLVESAAEVQPEQIRSRIDEAFRASDAASAFALTGPLFPPQAGIPTLPSPAPRPRWQLAGASVDAWSAYIDEASRRFGIPRDWVRGVMQMESGGRTHLNGRLITSSAGAMGLMQVMPATFAEMSALHGLGADPHDPRANILAGTAYLRAMYDRYGPAHFLAAYNAGPGRVDEHLRTGRALPGETRAYTAALQPHLLPGVVTSGASDAQDLTSSDAMRRVVSSFSRPLPQGAADPAAATVFAVAPAAGPAPVRHAELQPNDRLFVPLTAADRRRETKLVDAQEN